jgi:hypothetical protein
MSLPEKDEITQDVDAVLRDMDLVEVVAARTSLNKAQVKAQLEQIEDPDCTCAGLGAGSRGQGKSHRKYSQHNHDHVVGGQDLLVAAW